MSSQSQETGSTFHKPPESLRGNRTKKKSLKNRCLSFHLPPKDSYNVSVEDSNTSGSSASVDNIIEAYHYGSHRQIPQTWTTNDFKVIEIPS